METPDGVRRQYFATTSATCLPTPLGHYLASFYAALSKQLGQTPADEISGNHLANPIRRAAFHLRLHPSKWTVRRLRRWSTICSTIR